MEIVRDLWEAAEDLRFLLNRGYPKDASLQLVGNQYNLDYDYRHLLRRGIFPASIVEERLRKMVSAGELRGKGLAVDGYNVIITLESALKAKTIVLADDGFVRDISGVSGGYRETTETSEALELIMTLLQSSGPAEVIFFLDSPISGSGELAARIRILLNDRGIEGYASAIKVPERIMAGYKGIIASSDTDVIDRAERIFDLAGHLIKDHLRAPCIDMNSHPTRMN